MGSIEINDPKIKGLIIEAKGDVINDGEINAHEKSFVGISTEGNYTSNKGKINFIADKNRIWYEKWWVKYLVFPLVVIGIAYYLGLSK